MRQIENNKTMLLIFKNKWSELSRRYPECIDEESWSHVKYSWTNLIVQLINMATVDEYYDDNKIRIMSTIINGKFDYFKINTSTIITIILYAEFISIINEMVQDLTVFEHFEGAANLTKISIEQEK